MNSFSETVLLSTHNICFGPEIRKFKNYALLTTSRPVSVLIYVLIAFVH